MLLAVFWTGKPPGAEIRKFFTGVRMQKPIHVLFQKWLKWAQDKCPKGRVALVTEKKQNTFWNP